MPVVMTSLKTAKNGNWFSRKAIPEDVREPYRLAYGISREERFRLPGSVRLDRAKQAFREWDAKISGRFAALGQRYVATKSALVRGHGGKGAPPASR